MINYDFLDKALIYLKETEGWNKAFSHDSRFSEEQNKYLFQAFKKMETDGYVYSKETNITNFYISFNGIIALGEFDNAPYKTKKNIELRNKIWEYVKILAVVINAIVILAFTILTYCAQFLQIKD